MTIRLLFGEFAENTVYERPDEKRGNLGRRGVDILQLLGTCNDFGADFSDEAKILKLVDNDPTSLLVKTLVHEKVLPVDFCQLLSYTIPGEDLESRNA